MSPIELELQRIDQDCNEFLSWADAERQAIQNKALTNAAPSYFPHTLPWVIPALAGVGIGLIAGIAISGIFFS